VHISTSAGVYPANKLTTKPRTGSDSPVSLLAAAPVSRTSTPGRRPPESLILDAPIEDMFISRDTVRYRKGTQAKGTQSQVNTSGGGQKARGVETPSSAVIPGNAVAIVDLSDDEGEKPHHPPTSNTSHRDRSQTSTLATLQTPHARGSVLLQTPTTSRPTHTFTTSPAPHAQARQSKPNIADVTPVNISAGASALRSVDAPLALAIVSAESDRSRRVHRLQGQLTSPLSRRTQRSQQSPGRIFSGTDARNEWDVDDGAINVPINGLSTLEAEWGGDLDHNRPKRKTYEETPSILPVHDNDGWVGIDDE